MNTGPSSTLRRPAFFYGWVIAWTLCIVNTANHANATFNFGLFVIPMTAELGISRGLIGLAQTARLLAAGASSYLIGRLLDRYGGRLVVAGAGLVTGLAIMSLSTVQETWQLFLVFIVMGLAGMTAPGNLLTSVPVAKWFIRKRGRAMAIAMLGVGIGGIFFPPLSVVFINAYGWRQAWVLLGATSTLIIVPLSLLLLRRQPEDMGLTPDGGEETPAQREAVRRRPVAEDPVWTARQALRTPVLWMLTVAFMLMGFAQGGANVHRTPYFIERGFDPLVVSYALAVDALVAAITVILGGVLLERFPSRLVGAGGALLSTSSVVLMLAGSTTFLLFAHVTLWGAAFGINVLVQTYIWAAYYGRAFLGTIRGIVMPATLVSLALGPPIVGVVYDILGSYTPAWWAALGLYGTAAAIILLSRPPRRVAVPVATPTTG